MRKYAGEQNVDGWGCAYGLEPTPELYVEHTVEILREVRRVLRSDGVCFINIGDSYAGSNCGSNDYREVTGLGATPTERYQGQKPGLPLGLKPKDLCLIPFRVALAAQADGWWVRSIIIWSKPNPMPESVKDRPTESHEYILMLTKSARYYWDIEAVREKYTEPMNRWGGDKLVANGHSTWDEGTGQESYRDRNMRPNPAGRNIRTVWDIATQPFSDWGYDFASADYVGADGKPYKVSPDCPIHGQRHGKGTLKMGAYDGQLDSPANGSDDIANGHAPMHEGESASTPDHDGEVLIGDSGDGQTPESTVESKTSASCEAKTQIPCHNGHTQKTPDSNMDYCDPPCSPIATGHSKRNHKKGHVAATSPSCIVSVEMPCHTDGKPIQSVMAGLDAHTSENSNGGDSVSSERELCPSVQTPSRNVHTSYSNYTCTCRISQTSHFATFPEEIPRRCIMAATPPRSCVCGAPYERVVENKPMEIRRTDWGDNAGNRTASSGTMITPAESKTLGWRPTCTCNGETQPALVLDPFGGSGTVGKVAKELGRRAVLVDISEEYCKLAVKRCSVTSSMIPEEIIHERGGC